MATQNTITKIMESMGWTDGSFIPIANEDNKLLMKSMEDVQIQKENKSLVHQDLVRRTKKFHENLSVVKTNLQHNLKLLDAHRSQLSDEYHIFKVAEYEDGTFTKKLRELHNETAELDKYNKSTKGEVDKSYQIVTKLSGKIKWSKDALEEWQKAMARGEGNNQMIVKYCKEDAVAAHHLEEKRRACQASLSKYSEVLTEKNEEIRSLENVLDRTGQLYRQAHQDRRNLVNTWKEAVLSMRLRDKEIENYSQEFLQCHTVVRCKAQELKEHEEFLERQIENNNDIERQITELNSETAIARQHLTNFNNDVALKLTDSITLKKLSQSLSNKLQQRRSSNRQANKELIEKDQTVERTKNILATLQKKLNGFSEKNWNAQERLNSLDEMVDTEENICLKLASENSRLDGAYTRFSKILQDIQHNYKTQEMKMHGIESDIKLEKVSFKNLEAELIRQTEIIYNVDLKTTLLESRIRKMEGKSSNMDPQIFNKFNEMKIAVEEKTIKLDLVKKQIIKVEEDMRLLTDTISFCSAELEKTKSRLQGKRCEYEGGIKELSSTTLSNQEQLVDLSVLKMRVHQLEQLLTEQKDKVFNLKRHQTNLELAMNERIVEIKMRQELLRQRRRHLDDELTQLRADIGERALKIVAIQARYEHASELLGRNDDGSFVTATQIKIETAQEKMMLLRDGNQLNERVIRAEKDIEAIENTLVLLNVSNKNYKKSMEPVKEDNKEMCDLTEMAEKYGNIQCAIKQHLAQLKGKTSSQQTLATKVSELEKGLEYMRKIRLDNNDQLMKYHKEILEQKSKMERAQRELKLARKTVKQKIDDKNIFYAFEKELNLKELEHQNQSALQQLADMVDMTASMGLVVSKYLFEKGLTIPHPTKSRSLSGSQRNTSGSSEGSKWSPRMSQFSYGFERDSATSVSMTIQSTPRQVEPFAPAIVSLNFMREENPTLKPSSHSSMSNNMCHKTSSRSTVCSKSQKNLKGSSTK